MAFIYKKSRNPNGGRELIEFILTASQIISVGEAVKLSSGKIVTWGAGGIGLGIVESIRKSSGAPVTDNGDGGDFVGTYTAESGTTVVAVVDVSIESLYSVSTDAALGTTNNSDDAGINIDCDSTSLTLSETSAKAANTTASFVSIGPDTSPGAQDNALLVSIQESQIKI